MDRSNMGGRGLLIAYFGVSLIALFKQTSLLKTTFSPFTFKPLDSLRLLHILCSLSLSLSVCIPPGKLLGFSPSKGPTVSGLFA